MVDTRTLGHELTVYVFSQLPIEVADQVIQAINGTSSSFKQHSSAPWRIQNRYYSTTVQFQLLESVKQLSCILEGSADDDEAGSEDIPALLVLVDSAALLETNLLEELDSSRIDIPLVVGCTRDGTTSRDSDDLTQDCLSFGFEYVPFVHADIADSEGRTGAARIAEALQARIWPNSEVASSSIHKRLPAACEDSEDEEDVAAQSATPAANPSASGPGDEAAPGFEDDFAPFVSASAPGGESAAFSLPSNLLSGDLDAQDPTDPTAKLTSLFASLTGFREQAMSMPDAKRKDFAAEVAMRFAKQLDELVDSGADELGDDAHSEDEHEEEQEFRAAMREARRRDS